jgi:tetratricopeptide (TPR) repeat protein
MTAAERERREQNRVEMVKRLRAAVAATEDPEARGKLEGILKNLEKPPPAIDPNEAIALYNEAVDRANQRDYVKAIALLEDLLPKVEDPELAGRIKTLLEAFRRDAARLQRPVE